MRKIAIILSIHACFFLVFYGNGYARVSGPCVNCHTMHNSQDGTAMATQMNSTFSGFETDATPNKFLLVSDCLGCHSSTVPGEAISGIGAPIVYTTVEPSFGFDDGTYEHGLAGGNFYYVRTDGAKGHNVFLGEPDTNLTNAPGSTVSCGNPATVCHANLSEIDPMLGTRQGCTKCHMMRDFSLTKNHHADDSNPVVGSELNDEDAFYRFLQGHISGVGRGVSGIEDTDWQETTAADDHNEYLGNSGTKTGPANMSSLGHTMTGFCCGCHGNFHWEQSGSSWVRHPSDAVIPDSGEYASAFGASGGTGTYDPQVPVARGDLTGWTDPSGTVTLDDDMVMCLSCHRAHASPYDDMLRWDYDDMIVGSSGTGGCFVCHTEKN